jgi:bifunctional UDP-N-acetylglucosamine pyrophosphorylase/glucosamine-1-phosphate N-acetyltransferase
MQAVILAAGEGTRMRPLTYNRPKVMLPVLGTPILQHIVNSCVQAHVERVIIVTGYQEEAIRSHFEKAQLGIQIEYVTQKNRCGTADAVGQAKELLDERFLAINGDSLISPRLLKLLAEAPQDRVVVVAAKRVDNPANYGAVVTKGDVVLRIVEKPNRRVSNLANIGVYAFDPIIFDAIAQIGESTRGEYEITDAIQLLIERGHSVQCRNVEEQWIDVGRPWDLLNANELLQQTFCSANEGVIEPLATVEGAVQIGQGSRVKNGAYVTGPVIIGECCEIGPNCYIRPVTCIGNRVKIGNGVEVKNSVIMDDTKVGHLSYIGDSIIGQRCNFGAGTVVANLRFDERPIQVGGVSTARRKLGVIMGDDVHTGINSAINVGTSIGPRSTVAVGALAAGVYPPGSRIGTIRSK